MLKAKKRITKREMKEDKLVTTYFQLMAKFEDNKRLISGVLFGLVIVAIAGWFYINNRMADDANASADLGKIVRYYDEGNFERAINGIPEENIRGLQSIVDTYSNTAAVQLTKLYLANAYYELKTYDKALQYYRDTDISDKTLMASVLAGAAACYEAMQEHDNAALQYERAASKNSDGVLAGDYLHSAALNFIVSGKKEKAIEILKRLKRDYPNSTYAKDADRLISFASI